MSSPASPQESPATVTTSPPTDQREPGLVNKQPASIVPERPVEQRVPYQGTPISPGGKPEPRTVALGSDPRTPIYVTFSASTAFKTGFFGAFGVAAAWAIAAAGILIIGYLLALIGAALFF